MNNPYDLEKLGKDAAKEYVTNNVALNDTILKTAETHNLNQQQVNRVVESANVDAYLHLIKAAEDNYVDFPLADSKSIYSRLTVHDDSPSNVSDDYDTPPTKTASYDFFTVDYDFEKTANAKLRYGQLRKEASDVEGRCQYIYDQSELTRADFHTNYEKLWSLTKQAVLQGENINNILEIVKVASPTYHEYISTDFIDFMDETMPHIERTKEASVNGIINPKSNLYNIAKELEYLGDRYTKIASALDIYSDRYEELRKEATTIGGLKKLVVGAGQTIAGATKGILKSMAKNKKLVLVGIGGGLVYGAGKSKGRRAQGEILQTKMLPAKYRNPKY
jgi:hypothetical protein